jgi:hypothetical protein
LKANKEALMRDGAPDIAEMVMNIRTAVQAGIR